MFDQDRRCRPTRQTHHEIAPEPEQRVVPAFADPGQRQRGEIRMLRPQQRTNQRLVAWQRPQQVSALA